MKFSELGLRPELLQGIEKLGFETPTPVQAEAIPVLLETVRDVVALAQTGTGKTAAFGLPILELLDTGHPAPQALVLCPTRELCMQITRDMEAFAIGLPAARVLAVYGGSDIRPQITALRRGVHVVVATPGRMLDLLRRSAVDFSRITRVVLDEADEMLNMGFTEDLEAILSDVPEHARTFLFSATMPREVEKISRKYMDNPVEITLGTRNSGAENVSHEYYVVQARDRYRVLRRLVDVYPRMYGIVFCRTRLETQQIADQLSVDGYNAEPLHGDLSQQQRDSVMKKFRKRHVQILVATDVAARGLDVTDLSHVINYSLPDDLNGYTHRSGRTGRAGKEGISVSIVNLRERHKVKHLEKAIGQKFKEQPVPTGAEIGRVRLMNLAERVRDTDPGEGLIDAHLDEMCGLLEELSKAELIKRFAHIGLHRMLDFYKDAQDLRAAPVRPQRVQSTNAGGMAELVMNLGVHNGLTPQKLMTLVNVADRDRSVAIGRINISRFRSYFEVPADEAQAVVDSFTRGNLDLKGRRVRVDLAVKDGGGPPKKPYRAQQRPGSAPRGRLQRRDR